MPPDDLPGVQDPSSGWVASCNQKPLPDDYPFSASTIGFEFADPGRFRRLSALIAAREKVSVEDCREFQTDQTLDMPARLVSRVLTHCRDMLPDTLRRCLAEWDGAMTEDSPEAAFFAVWTERFLRRRLVERLVPEDARTIVGGGDWRSLLEAPVTAEDFETTVRAALNELSGRLGPDPMCWRLGDVQTLAVAHPLSAVTRQARLGDIGPLPLGGHANTLNKADSAGPDLAVKHGASFRLIMDVGNWSDALAVNMPGQSGDPRDPHYKDLLEAWHTGDYVPLLWKREEIEAATTERLTLAPGSGMTAR